MLLHSPHIPYTAYSVKLLLLYLQISLESSFSCSLKSLHPTESRTISLLCYRCSLLVNFSAPSVATVHLVILLAITGTFSSRWDQSLSPLMPAPHHTLLMFGRVSGVVDMNMLLKSLPITGTLLSPLPGRRLGEPNRQRKREIFCFVLFFGFLGPLPQHMEGPKLGV